MGVCLFDWRNEHERHGIYRSIENKTERLRLFPKQAGKGTAYQQAKPEWDWKRENKSQQGNEAYAPTLSRLLQMHTAFYTERWLSACPLPYDGRTGDYQDVLAMKIEYFVHEDYGLFGYEELYRYG